MEISVGFGEGDVVDLRELEEVEVQEFHGRLLDGERILFRRVSGVFEAEDRQGVRSGRLEAHEGTTTMLRTNCPYRLSLDDGRSEEIYITGLRQSGTAGVAMLAFQTLHGINV